MIRSLYVHVPFCAHRCGYCDFVTVTGHAELHGRYVAGLRRELELRHPGLDGLDTIFVGGGTPTLLEPAALGELVGWLGSLLAPGGELTVECNPETVDAQLAATLVDGGVTRVSLGAQSFSAHVLATLERRASPETVRAAVATLRAAGLPQLNIDLIWGVPGQTAGDLDRDLDAAIALAPDHVSAYELEFKPGTRLARAFPDPAAVLGDEVEEFYERAIDRLGAAGFDWYETANFAREGRVCRHNLAYWTRADWAGIGIGAVETVGAVRHTNLPNIARWMDALERGEAPPARVEELDAHTLRSERVLLQLRLAGPHVIPAADLGPVVDPNGLERMATHELLTYRSRDGGSVELELTRRGRLLLHSVLDELLVEPSVVR